MEGLQGPSRWDVHAAGRKDYYDANDYFKNAFRFVRGDSGLILHVFVDAAEEAWVTNFKKKAATNFHWPASLFSGSAVEQESTEGTVKVVNRASSRSRVVRRQR